MSPDPDHAGGGICFVRNHGTGSPVCGPVFVSSGSSIFCAKEAAKGTIGISGIRPAEGERPGLAPEMQTAMGSRVPA